MIAMRRAADRRHVHLNRQDTWSTFVPADGSDAPAAGFGALKLFEESRLLPGASLSNGQRRDIEIVTYVHQGALAHDDSTGGAGVVRSGEFQRMTSNLRIRHSARNASQTEAAHIYQLLLQPAVAERDHDFEQKYFSTAERQNTLRVVASPDRRRNSLSIGLDVLVLSAILDPGQHLIHALPPGRCAWLHLVSGDATIGEFVLSTGDAVGVTSAPAVSLTANEATEILLVDLASEDAETSGRLAAKLRLL